jgi:hypothetical protein
MQIDNRIVYAIIAVVVIVVGVFFFRSGAVPPPQEVDPLGRPASATGTPPPAPGRQAPGLTPDMPRPR